jgi:outer membrane protein assembly factor BamB
MIGTESTMHCVAVVPIFLNAGTALLPIIVGFVASHGSVALRPRELFHLIMRRPARAAMGFVAFALFVAAFSWLVSFTTPAPENADAHDWAQIARELMARQRNHEPLNVGNANEAPINLRRLWRFNREGAMFLSTPAVGPTRVFVAGSRYELNDFVGFLTCLDRETGEVIWQVTRMDGKPLPPFASSPVLTPDGGSLLIGQGLHADHDCGLCCFDTDTGVLRWVVRAASHIESTPAVRGDFCVVGVGAMEGPDGKPRGDPGHVIAVRVSDGQLLWRQPLNDAESSPAIDNNGIIYIGSAVNGNAVVALRAETDEQLRRKKLDRVLWRTQLPTEMASAVLLVDGLVIAGGGNSSFTSQNPSPTGLVVALDKKSGNIVWKADFADSVLGDLAAHDGVVFCPVRTGEVVALEQSTGKVLWRTSINKTSPVLSGCVVKDHKIYAISNDGLLAILDETTGAAIERIIINDPAKPASGMTFASPVISGGRIYVATETGGAQCLVGTGAPRE